MTTLTLMQQRDNLPADVTTFIGRRRELAAVAAAIGRHRLVTLRGAGGVGKTRLALRAAQLARDSFADGCWLVELSALRQQELLPRTVSAALGLPDKAAGDPLAVLAARLADQEMLLVLDTCEHLVEPCGRLVRRLLRAAPGLRILVTSREPLGVADEHALLISPLEVPIPGMPGPQAADCEAVELFVERARAAVPGFSLTPENTGLVVQLCRRLDGIALALELAAVRLRSMPLEEILARLTDRFRILGTARTSLDRHRTLRGAVSWSYELCTPDERRLWARLSVFPGSFTEDAAEHVCGPGAGQVLTRLAGKSIVNRDEGTGRYQMLDTMREFGAEWLPDDADGLLRARHRDYFLSLTQRAAAASLTPAQAEWMGRLGQETDNLRTALDYSFGTPGQEAAGLRMTLSLRTYWLMVGQFSEGRRWHKLAMATGVGSAGHAWAVFGAGVLAVQQSDLASATPLLALAAALAVVIGDEDLAALVTDARGMVAFYSGDLETARSQYESALAAHKRTGFSDTFALGTYARLASTCLLAFETDRAIELCEEYLGHCDELGELWGRGSALWVRGAARWMAGDSPAAIEDALACLVIKEKIGDLHTITMSFDLLAVCLVATGDYDRAAVLYGASETLWKIINAPVLMGPAYAEIRGGAAQTARTELGDERFEALCHRGMVLPLGGAIAVARGEAAAADSVPPAITIKQLTRREREIAALVADGLGNRDIAERLFLSKRTVDSHIEHIFTKLGFSSRTQLTNWVLGQPSN